MELLFWLLLSPFLLFFAVFGWREGIYYSLVLVGGLFSRPVSNHSPEPIEEPSWPAQRVQPEASGPVAKPYIPLQLPTVEAPHPIEQVTALQARIAQLEGLERQLVDARLQLRKYENTLATTTDIPEGKLVLRGRLVPSQGRLSIVTKGGKPFKVSVAQGWEFGADLGDQVLLEALWREETGWTAWRVIVEVPNAHLKPLDEQLVAKLTAKKEPRGAPNFDDLDRAAENAVRTASHSKTAISLHMVFPTHCRFSLTEDQAADLKAIVVEVVEEIDLGKVAAVEVGNTEGGNLRDHLHLLVTAFNHTVDSIGKQVGRLKALSSGRLRRKHPNLPEKLWSASYWVSSAGGSLDKVIAYIGENAEKHSE